MERGTCNVVRPSSFTTKMLHACIRMCDYIYIYKVIQTYTRMYRHVHLQFCLLLSLFIPLLTSCGNGNSSSSANAGEDFPALRIAILPINECEVLRHAQENGLARELGLNLQFVEYDALMDIDTAMLSNTADVYFEDSLRVCRMEKDSLHNPTLLFSVPVKAALIANKDKGIDKIADLRTNMVGLVRWSQLEDWANEVTQAEGLGQMDVYYAQVNSVPLRFCMVNAGLIDAAVITYPWADSLKVLGHSTLRDTILDGTGFYVNSATLRDSTLQAQAAKLKELYLKGLVSE